MDEIKQQRKKEFIKKAKESGFTDEQAEFLWIEIEDKAFVRNNFGGFFNLYR